MVKNKGLKFAVLGLVVGAVALSLIADITSDSSMIRNHGKIRAYKGEIETFRSLVQLGTPAEDLKPLFDSQSFRVIGLQETHSGARVIPPVELGAHNWVMLIDVSDGRVVSIRVRTMYDLDGKKPFLAPADLTLAD